MPELIAFARVRPPAMNSRAETGSFVIRVRGVGAPTRRAAISPTGLLSALETTCGGSMTRGAARTTPLMAAVISSAISESSKVEDTEILGLSRRRHQTDRGSFSPSWNDEIELACPASPDHRMFFVEALRYLTSIPRATNSRRTESA